MPVEPAAPSTPVLHLQSLLTLACLEDAGHVTGSCADTSLFHLRGEIAPIPDKKARDLSLSARVYHFGALALATIICGVAVSCGEMLMRCTAGWLHWALPPEPHVGSILKYVSTSIVVKRARMTLTLQVSILDFLVDAVTAFKCIGIDLVYSSLHIVYRVRAFT